MIAIKKRFRRTTGGKFALSLLLVLALAVFPAARLAADEGETGDTGETSEGFEFQGVVQGLPNGAGLSGDWTVSGKVIHVSAATLFPTEAGDPAITLGSSVSVKGVPQQDGSIVASLIDANVGSNFDGEQQGEH
jgi:hypothetical protein